MRLLGARLISVFSGNCADKMSAGSIVSTKSFVLVENFTHIINDNMITNKKLNLIIRAVTEKAKNFTM